MSTDCTHCKVLQLVKPELALAAFTTSCTLFEFGTLMSKLTWLGSLRNEHVDDTGRKTRKDKD